MTVLARCDRPDCSRPASASLSYRYDDGSVWIGALSADDESQHHLCASHADRLRVPVGWELIDLRVVTATVGFADAGAVA